MSEFQLLMRTGPTPGKVISLMNTEQFLGRDGSNTIIINDAELSRRHCHFIFVDEGFELEDLGSTNGTYVNEKRISGRYRLQFGDLIRLGDNVSLVFEIVGEAESDTMLTGQETPPRGMPTPLETPPVQETPPPVAPVPTPRPKVLDPVEEMLEVPAKKRPNKLLIGCGVIAIIAFCVFIGGWYYVDTYAPEYYCYLLPFLPGCP